MTDLTTEFLAAVEAREGKPFLNHFKPFNGCNKGAFTLQSCMERGMDDRGYDCSGLVIAGLCDVLDIEPKLWPTSFRHLKQMEILGVQRPAQPGDIVMMHGLDAGYQPWSHMGVFVNAVETIHASNLTKTVDRGLVPNIIELSVIAPDELLVRAKVI